MEHANLEKMASTAPMLPEKDESLKLGRNCGGKILLREDTVTNVHGTCMACGSVRLTCSGVRKSWSVLCWGRQSDKKYYCLLLLLCATFVLSLLGTIIFCFTDVINDTIKSNMIIRKDSLAYSLWKNPTVHPLMKVHVFNYTNVDQVRSGDDKLLKVQEIGPYVYSQLIKRTNINFDEDRLSYKERNYYKYKPEYSGGTTFDKVVVPNLPLMGAINKVIRETDKGHSIASTFGSMLGQTLANIGSLQANHHDAFVQLPVLEFLWGYDDDIINAANLFKSKKFGLLSDKNATESVKFTINTGAVDKNKINVIEKVDGQSSLSHWNDEYCNRIDATDGTIFPPSRVKSKEPLYVYMPKMCRRLRFVFESEVQMSNGVVLNRYIMPRDIFHYPTQEHPEINPDNQCFCNLNTGCPPQGVSDASACNNDAPVMLSLPHFYLGENSLRRRLVGLKPNGSLHDSYLDIHPKLGIALQGKSSIQINIQVKRNHRFTAVNFLPDGLILPVAWIEIGVEELDESLKSLVYHGTYSTEAVQLGLTVLCMIALIVSSVCLLCHIVQRRRRPCLVVKKEAVQMLFKQPVNGQVISNAPVQLAASGQVINNAPVQLAANGQVINNAPVQLTGNGQVISNAPVQLAANGQVINNAPVQLTGNGQVISNIRLMGNPVPTIGNDQAANESVQIIINDVADNANSQKMHKPTYRYATQPVQSGNCLEGNANQTPGNRPVQITGPMMHNEPVLYPSLQNCSEH